MKKISKVNIVDIVSATISLLDLNTLNLLPSWLLNIYKIINFKTSMSLKGMEKVSIFFAKEYCSFESTNCVLIVLQNTRLKNLKISTSLCFLWLKQPVKYASQKKKQSHPYIVQHFSVGDILCDSPIRRKRIVRMSVILHRYTTHILLSPF